MSDNQEYFNQIKQECINECKTHSLKEVAEGMFATEEVADLFLKQEKEDEAYSFIIDLIGKYFTREAGGKIYIPGSGTGGLARRIMDDYPKMTVIQIDSSPKMSEANKKASKNYKNTDILQGDILNLKQSPKSVSAIISYGVMRYIPEDKRNNLVSSWALALVKNGIVIVGEGIAKDVIDGISSQGYASEKLFERDAKLFRNSLFYTLLKRYHSDNKFRGIVNGEASDNNLSFADVLNKIAGYAHGKIYVKVLQK